MKMITDHDRFIFIGLLFSSDIIGLLPSLLLQPWCSYPLHQWLGEKTVNLKETQEGKGERHVAKRECEAKKRPGPGFLSSDHLCKNLSYDPGQTWCVFSSFFSTTSFSFYIFLPSLTSPNACNTSIKDKEEGLQA